MTELWAITLGGLLAGTGALLARDHIVRQRRAGRPVVSASMLRALCILSFVLFSAGLIAPVVARSQNSHHHRPRHASQMQYLGKGLWMYADLPENGGRFPAGDASPRHSLWRLYPNIIKDPHVFFGPVSPPTLNPDNARASLAFTAYVYLEGYGPDDDAAIILYQRAPEHGGRHVLYGDQHVEWLEEADFQAALAANPAPKKAAVTKNE